MNGTCRYPKQRGMTLIELMVVVVILGILVAIAYPSYADFVMRSKRQAAKNMLYAIADRQEQFFQDNKEYATALKTLGYDADTIGIDEHGELAKSGATLTYEVTLKNASKTAYTIEATAKGVQAARDKSCGTLALTHTGDRTPASGNCW